MENEQAVIQTEQAAGQPQVSDGSTQAQDADVIAAAEALRRQRQSQQDKEAAEIAKRFKAWKASGNSGTVEQMLQQPAAIQSQPGQPVQANAPVVQQSVSGQQPDPVIHAAQTMMQTIAGGMIPEDAPEFQMLNKDTADPSEFLKSVFTASTAFAERSANLSNPARIPSLAGGASSHTPNYANMSGVDILEEYNRTHPL